MSAKKDTCGFEAQRRLLIVTTAIAVVSDAVLIPFYPRLFAETFGVQDSEHVGLYLAATCLTVMFALPMWAQVARWIPTLVLLIGAQVAAGGLSLVCFASTDLTAFWVASLAMIVFKASYLLVYPYLMRLTDASTQVKTIGALTVIVHLGAIAGAVVGGWVLERFTARHGFLVMAFGDFAQMAVCLFLVLRKARAPRSDPDVHGSFLRSWAKGRWVPLAKLASIMLIFYFSAFVVRPFFVQYWEMRSSIDHELLSGLVFSIPAWMSLVCLVYQHRNPDPPPILRSFALCTLGLLLQSLPNVFVIGLGLVIFGWSLFRAMVHLDAIIFETHPPELYAAAFSQMNFFQQLGALIAFYVAGFAVSAIGLMAPLAIAAGGCVMTALLYQRFGVNIPATEKAPAGT